MKIKYRPVGIIDLDRLLSHRNQADTRKWLENETPLNKEDQHKWFNEGGADDFLIINYDKKDIGLARIKKINSKLLQVGLDLFFEYRGKGLASKCFYNLIHQHCKEYKKFELWIFTENKSAMAVYIKNGFDLDVKTPARLLKRSWASDTDVFTYVKMIFNK